MTYEQTYAVLNTLLLKMALYDNRKEREEVRVRAVDLLNELQKHTDETAKLLDEISKKIITVAKEYAELKRKLAFFEIAAGQSLTDEIYDTVACMEKAIEYVQKEGNP